MAEADTEALLPLEQARSEDVLARRWRCAPVAATFSLGLLLAVKLVHMSSQTRKVGSDALGHLTEFSMVAEDASHLEKQFLHTEFPIYTSQTDLDVQSEGGEPQPKRWLISLPEGASQEEEDQIADLFGDLVVGRGETIRFILVEGTLDDLREKTEGHTGLKISFVEQDVAMRMVPESPGATRRLGSQSDPGWGLDRSDNRHLPLDQKFEKTLEGAGAHVYVFDTGINVLHEDFGGRAIPTLEIVSSNMKVCEKEDTGCATDRQGHGTHCAGTVGGTQYGVAKEATLHAVKILGDDGSGSFSWFELALDWVISNGVRPSIVSASLGGYGNVRSTEIAVNVAVTNGVVVVVAAGNENDDACRYTPAYIPQAITVGATRSDDRRSVFSNHGNCLDIFAPGTAITSAGLDKNNFETFSGTSMACPHVAGAAALFMGSDPAMTPTQLLERLLSHSSKDHITDRNDGSPNKLLFVGDGDDPPPSPAPTSPPPSHNTCHEKGWKVIHGDCTIDDDCCLTSGNHPEHYFDDTSCTIEVGSDPGAIHQEHFATESGYDFLKIETPGGVLKEFSGDAGPHDEIPTGVIEWSSDVSVTQGGFKLCLPQLGTCPPNGWRPAPSCKASFEYEGITYHGCSTVDHDGKGWCLIDEHFGFLDWTDCDECSSDPCEADSTSCPCFLHRAANFCDTCPECGPCQDYCNSLNQ